ncbi:hypothetical protein [Microbaculum marinum]|uniref:Uncharacterized protein n=1 Tax=Microbaculum marinum TaxID=1764581 RepID=A0AAW9RTL0_9HYPH
MRRIACLDADELKAVDRILDKLCKAAAKAAGAIAARNAGAFVLGYADQFTAPP